MPATIVSLIAIIIATVLGLCAITSSATVSLSLSALSDTIAAAAVDQRAMWLGTFRPVAGQCTPSATCCCSDGNPLSVTVATSSDNGVVLSGGADGGTGCYGQKTLGGTMALSSTNPYSASITIPNLDLTVTAQLARDTKSLTISSTRTNCNVAFTRS